jgi:3-isopropylmalate/(R)-2-methylmalate dehydratase small subunit
MAYDKFNVLKSTAVPLPIENVDTDQIIPARFLKATKREAFGDNLFRDWRYNNDDTPKKEFPLNNALYSGKILVAGFFADIFKGNSLNIGLLPVQVSPAFLEKIFKAIEADPTTELAINLPEETITLLATGGKESFMINGYKKHNMLNGFDDIDYLQAMKEEINSFAAARSI